MSAPVARQASANVAMRVPLIDVSLRRSGIRGQGLGGRAGLVVRGVGLRPKQPNPDDWTRPSPFPLPPFPFPLEFKTNTDFGFLTRRRDRVLTERARERNVGEGAAGAAYQVVASEEVDHLCDQIDAAAAAQLQRAAQPDVEPVEVAALQLARRNRPEVAHRPPLVDLL